MGWQEPAGFCGWFPNWTLLTSATYKCDLGMRRSDAARGVRGGQQRLAADVGAFRHLERELVVRCGDYRTAATADGTAGAVLVADVLEGGSGGEFEGGGGDSPN